jgi:4-amino-4-deoxy-L-arabinose transferase-like glycosyltransferase
MARVTTANPTICLIGLLITIALFHSLTVRQGHIWGDDFAMYVSHARNIVEGRPYAQTGYLFNPASPVSPRMYPPVFPMLLAPVVKLFGLNLVPMKVEQVVFFVLALTAVYLFWRDDLTSKYALALVAIVGLSPHFWAAKDNVLSDLPFLLFFYVVAVLLRRVPRYGPGWRSWAILIGVVLYLTIGTRTAGIALVGGLLLYDILKYRTITRVTMVALSTCAALLIAQSHLIGLGFGNYDGHFHATLYTVADHLVSYPRTLAGCWVASTHGPYSSFLLGLVALLTLSGLWLRYKQGFTIVEALLAPYAAIAILWPFSPGIRLVFPFVPWIVFLALTGLRNLVEKAAPQHSAAALCSFLLLIAIPYVDVYRHADFGPISQSTGMPEFNQLCQAVRDRTAPNDVLVYFRARALALYTGRTASAYNYHGTEEELWEYAQKIHATHLITTDAFDEDRGFLSRCAQRNASKLQIIYQNPHFALYRIVPSQSQKHIPDSIKASVIQ